MDPKSFAVSLAKQAGIIMRKYFSYEIKRTWKKDNTPLTMADTRINDLVVKAVKKHYPSYGIIAEESGYDRPDSEYNWVCDPVDGTIPYSHGVPTATFSLALVKNGKPILGILYDPFTTRLYVAEKGKGTTLNGKRIRVSSQKTLKHGVVCLCFWSKHTKKFINLTHKLIDNGAMTVNTVCTTYYGMLVASGELVANVFPGKLPWDSAAQKIIVEEAGGKVTSLDGGEQRYDRETKGILATNGIIHDKLLSLIKKHP